MIFKLSRGNYWEFREQMQMRRNWEIPQAGGTLMCGEGPGTAHSPQDLPRSYSIIPRGGKDPAQLHPRLLHPPALASPPQHCVK